MEKILYVGIGGLLGATLRYLVNLWSVEKLGFAFPYGTLIVNIIGCFILGVFVTICSEKLLANENLRLFVVVGFAGGLTTFSALSYETIKLVESYEILMAGLNIGANAFLGIIFMVFGMAIGRSIL